MIGVQLLLQKRKPWLPRVALKMPMPRRLLSAFIKSARPVARRVDKIVQPRLAVLAEPPWAAGAGLVCVLAALATFPLSLLPFGPVVPGVAICLVGLGLTAKDGLALLLSATPIVIAAVAIFLHMG